MKALSNLAGICSSQAKRDEAIALYKEAIAAAQQLTDTGNATLASIYNNLALVYADNGNYQLAADLELRPRLDCRVRCRIQQQLESGLWPARAGRQVRRHRREVAARAVAADGDC